MMVYPYFPAETRLLAARHDMMELYIMYFAKNCFAHLIKNAVFQLKRNMISLEVVRLKVSTRLHFSQYIRRYIYFLDVLTDLNLYPQQVFRALSILCKYWWIHTIRKKKYLTWHISVYTAGLTRSSIRDASQIFVQGNPTFIFEKQQFYLELYGLEYQGKCLQNY